MLHLFSIRALKNMEDKKRVAKFYPLKRREEEVYVFDIFHSGKQENICFNLQGKVNFQPLLKRFKNTKAKSTSKFMNP